MLTSTSMKKHVNLTPKIYTLFYKIAKPNKYFCKINNNFN